MSRLFLSMNIETQRPRPGTLMNNIHGGYSDINKAACSGVNGGGKTIVNASVAQFAQSEALVHHTTVPLATVGGDVCWITAPMEYPQYDRAIAYTNARPALSVRAR